MIIIILILSILILLYLFLLMPRIFNRPDMKMFDIKNFAHRGLYDGNHNVVENSLDAFRLAIENGYGIELDVHLSADGEVVVTHDWTLERIYKLSKRVSETSYTEMKKLGVPHLKEVLDLISGQVPLIIEVKAEHTDMTICKVMMDLLLNYTGYYCIQSFNPFVLIWYKKHHPNVIRGQLSMNFYKEKTKYNKILYFFLQNLLTNFLTKPDYIAYKIEHVNSISVQICHRLYKIKLAGWTLKGSNVTDMCDFYIFEQ